MSAFGDVNTDIPGNVDPVILVVDARDMGSSVLHYARRTPIFYGKSWTSTMKMDH